MEQTNAALETRIAELEAKVKSLDRQIRNRNSTLACVLAAAGGSVRVPADVYRKVLNEFAGASFNSQIDGQTNEYVVTAEMLPKNGAAA